MNLCIAYLKTHEMTLSKDSKSLLGFALVFLMNILHLFFSFKKPFLENHITNTLEYMLKGLHFDEQQHCIPDKNPIQQKLFNLTGMYNSNKPTRLVNLFKY